MNSLIIGASSGIGKKLAENLLESGHKVWGTYCETTANSQGNLQMYPLDVLAEDLVLDFLPDELDGLVYCPGNIALRAFEKIPAQDFLQDYALQVLGAIKVLQKTLPILKKSPQAAVVLFSSVAANLGLPYHSQVAASKAAIEGLTRSLAAEYAPHVRINCIAPSLVDTPLAQNLLNTSDKKTANALRHPLKKIGQPEDIAQMAEFLLSQKSQWITGQVFHVDGGIAALKV